MVTHHWYSPVLPHEGTARSSGHEMVHSAQSLQAAAGLAALVSVWVPSCAGHALKGGKEVTPPILRDERVNGGFHTKQSRYPGLISHRTSIYSTVYLPRSFLFFAILLASFLDEYGLLKPAYRSCFPRPTSRGVWLRARRRRTPSRWRSCRAMRLPCHR